MEIVMYLIGGIGLLFFGIWNRKDPEKVAKTNSAARGFPYEATPEKVKKMENRFRRIFGLFFVILGLAFIGVAIVHLFRMF